MKNLKVKTKDILGNDSVLVSFDIGDSNLTIDLFGEGKSVVLWLSPIEADGLAFALQSALQDLERSRLATP